jgi:signal transduction histidine kinase
VLRGNPAFHELFPHLPAQLSGMELSAVLPAPLAALLQQGLLAAGGQVDVRVTGPSAPGDMRRLRVEAQRLREAGWLLTLQDVGELLSELELRECPRHLTLASQLSEERERRRLADDLHDGIGQTLSVALLELKTAARAVTHPALTRAMSLLERACGEARTLLYELSPPILYDLGLLAALDWLVEDVRERWGLQVTLEDDGCAKPLTTDASVIVFRAVRELLGNVRKHSGAASAIVSLRCAGNELLVTVTDSGCGFDPAARTGSGYGSFSLRQRLGALGGSVELSSAPGRGTHVRLRVPLELSSCS